MDKLVIEVAINERVTREENPHAPYGADEVIEDAIACAKAGASIVHFHARHPDTGEQTPYDVASYIEVFRAVQGSSDVILYPTYPAASTKEQRIETYVKLANNPHVRIELAALDVGSVNTARYDASSHGFKDAGNLYINTHEEVLHFMQTLRSLDVNIGLGIREPGHIRHALCYAQMGLISAPLSVKLFFSDYDPYGLPPTLKGLQVYLDLLPPELRVNWSVVTIGPSHMRMNMISAAAGGHIRTGLGDNPRVNGKPLSNREQVEMAVDLGLRAGREIATPQEARHILGISR